MCEAFLAGEEAYRAVADKLVQISHYYGFDGWLVNIENVLSVSVLHLCDQMPTYVSVSPLHSHRKCYVDVVFINKPH